MLDVAPLAHRPAAVTQHTVKRLPANTPTYLLVSESERQALTWSPATLPPPVPGQGFHEKRAAWIKAHYNDTTRWGVDGSILCACVCCAGGVQVRENAGRCMWLLLVHQQVEVQRQTQTFSMYLTVPTPTGPSATKPHIYSLAAEIHGGGSRLRRVAAYLYEPTAACLPPQVGGCGGAAGLPGHRDRPGHLPQTLHVQRRRRLLHQVRCFHNAMLTWVSSACLP